MLFAITKRMMQASFRIAWRCLLTNETGNGEYVFHVQEEALSFAKSMDNKYPGVIKHWVEALLDVAG
jgi:hypothetical protein